MGLSAGEFASASLCVDAGEGLKTPPSAHEGRRRTTASPAFHTRILARAQYNVSPSGQIFAGASIYSHLVAV